MFAVPTIAILDLHASAQCVTAITGVEYAVIPLFALLAGVLLDRWQRRRTMIAANVVRLVALSSIPIAALFHVLTITHLLVVAAFVSLAGLFFDTAYQPFLATLVGREGYAQGNARMTLCAQIAAAVGNALGGPLVGILGGPLALVGNLGTYLFATAALMRMRLNEPKLVTEVRSFRRDARDGCMLIVRDRSLRAIALGSAVVYFGGTLVDCTLPLYAYRTLHLAPLAFGVMLALATSGVAVTTGLARRAARYGAPLLLIASAAGIATGDLLCTFAMLPLVAIVAGRTLVATTAPLYEMTAQELATSRVPDCMLARMNASLRTLSNLTIPIACFASGSLSVALGCIPTMLVGAGVLGAGVLVLAIMLLAGRTKTCSFSTTTISTLPSAA